MTTQPLSSQDLIRDVNAAQLLASDPYSSVWVGASAGSGKTKVLADRVSRLLLAGVAPQRILCLTFTRAAAAEMSIRLTQRLSKWATCEEATLEKELLALEGEEADQKRKDRARRLFAHVLACPGGMRIQTIHAFAQEILARFPLEAGLAPHFAVMEESDAQALRDDALDDLLEEVAEEQDTPLAKAFALLVDSLGEHKLRDVLKEASSQEANLKEALRKAGGIEALSHQIRSQLGLSPDETKEGLTAEGMREGAFDRAKLLFAARCLIEKGTKTFQEAGQKIATWLEQDEAGRARGFDAYVKTFLTDEGEIRAKLASKDVSTAFPAIEDDLKAEAQRLISLNERIDCVRCAQETEAILVFSMALIDAYKTRKGARALLDYNDLIAHTGALLARRDVAPWILFKLDGGLDHILVDEAQDTNPAQWKIIQTFADTFFEGQGAFEERERTLFVVGDEKQSIYSFQGADPRAFLWMNEHFSTRIRGAQKPYREVPLNVSFRSAPAILRAVDAVFERPEVRAGVSRDPVQHSAFRAEAAGRVEVWPLSKAPEEQTAKKTARSSKTAEDWAMPLGYERTHDPVAALAEDLARRIKAWIAQGHTVYDRELKRERAMTAGDVMVLVQTRGPFVEHFVRAMKSEAVPISGVDRMMLTTQLAVMDLMALMQFVLLPDDDLTLATILRGPFIGASEDELMDIAIQRNGSLWQSLCSKAQRNPRYALWRDYLLALLDRADQTPPLPLLVRLLTQPCPTDPHSGRRAIAARLGPDAEDPIDELLNEAERFGQNHSPSLQAFLHWLTASDVQIKREMEQALHCVRITTVHASKGLESPIVILPDTTRVPERQKLNKLLWDEQGALPFYIPREPMNAFLRGLRSQAYERQMQEYRRLLYVAMTRAADRLYVCGFARQKADEGKDNWYNLILQGVTPLHLEVATTGDEVVVADYARVEVSRASVNAPLADEGDRGAVAPADQQTESLPTWLFAPPPPEPSPPRPLVPSRPSEEEPPSISPQDGRFARGRIIHRLLQNLPELETEARETSARRFLSNPQHGLSAEDQADICGEVLGLLAEERFAPLFGPDSRAEQPIVGLSGDRLIAGQVDRLALVGDEVWIVDYKTNRPPPSDPAHIPTAYRGQMDAYRTVLAAIYPDRTIRCFLLWTYTLALMEVPL